MGQRRSPHAPAQAWLAAHAPHLRLFIDGEWRDPSDGEYFASVNPANATPLIDIAQGTAKDVDAAVRAAREAFPAWSATLGPRPRALSLRARPPDSEALAPACRAGDDGQRQADPRDARPGYPARRAPLLPPRRLGTTDAPASCLRWRRSVSSARSSPGISRC